MVLLMDVVEVLNDRLDVGKRAAQVDEQEADQDKSDQQID